MANTVNILSYANTFGDWVVTTNALTKENNDLAANNYVKPTGTLYLNSPSLGLQVANNAIIAGQLQVQGVGSSAYIQNNLRVDQQAYLQNTTLSLVTLGQANVGGPLLALSSGVGLAVSNNSTMAGYLTIGKTLDVTGATALGNTLTVTGATALGNTLAVTGATTLANTLTVAQNANFGNNVIVLNDVDAYNLNATSLTNTNNLIVRTKANLNDAATNTLQANVAINVIGTTYTNLLQANSTVNTATVSVTGGVYANTITANSSITLPKITVNSLVDGNSAAGFFNTIQTQGQLTVGGNFVITGATVYSTNTFTLSAAANNQISYLNVYRTGANASIRWNEPNKYWDMLDVNNSTYYRILTTELLSDSVSTVSSVTGASSTAANTLNNSIVAANTAMKSYVDSANTSMKSYVDTANTSMKSYVDGNVTTLNSTISTANTNMKSYVDTANTSMKSYVDGNVVVLNSTISTANSNMKSYVDTANTSMKSYVDANVVTLNSTISTANTNMKSYVDGLNTISNAINTTQNTNISSVTTYSQAGYAQANTGTTLAQTAFNSGNTTLAYAQAGYASSNTKVATVSGTSGRVTSSGTTAITLDLATAGPGASSATNASLTIDAYGRVTALSSGTPPVTNVTGTVNQITSTGGTTPRLYLEQNIHTGADFQINSLGVGTGATGTAGEIRATNNITAYYSDDRLKTRLGLIDNALDKVNSLNGFYYEANQTAQDLGYTVRKEVGLSAQEVQAILPEIVVPAPIDEKYLTIHYERVVPLLVEAIKELSRQVEELKKK